MRINSFRLTSYRKFAQEKCESALTRLPATTQEEEIWNKNGIVQEGGEEWGRSSEWCRLPSPFRRMRTREQDSSHERDMESKLNCELYVSSSFLCDTHTHTQRLKWMRRHIVRQELMNFPFPFCHVVEIDDVVLTQICHVNNVHFAICFAFTNSLSPIPLPLYCLSNRIGRTMPCVYWRNRF